MRDFPIERSTDADQISYDMLRTIAQTRLCGHTATAAAMEQVFLSYQVDRKLWPHRKLPEPLSGEPSFTDRGED